MAYGKGNRGEAVRLIQKKLNIKPDGIFGPVTKSAVKAFQREKGLKEDGIAGKNTLAALGFGKNARPADFKQYDTRWGAVTYSAKGDKAQTIASSGCGPAAASDIVSAWWDKDATPAVLCEKALSWGCRTKENGTASSFFRKVHEFYAPLSPYRHAVTSMDALIAWLWEGGLAAVNFKKSKWTKGGHYCVIYDYDGECFYINDPASAAASRAKGTYSEVKAARSAFYLFRRE